MHTLHGMVCAAVVIPGMANDSPHLRVMVETLPEGDGDVLVDAAYGGVQNCNAIRDSGRRHIIDTKSNGTIKGFNARLRFRKKHPRTFYRRLSLRNNVESVFSSMKARFGGVVRALKDIIGGVAVNYHLLQHGLCLRPCHGVHSCGEAAHDWPWTAIRDGPVGSKDMIRHLSLPVQGCCCKRG